MQAQRTKNSELCLISPFPPLLARSSEFYFCITCGNTLMMAFCSSLSFDKVWDLNSRGKIKKTTHKSPQVFWAKEHREIPMLKKSMITTCMFLVYQLYLNKAFFFFLSPWHRIFNLKSGRELMLAPLQVSDLACLGRGWRTTFLGRFHLILMVSETILWKALAWRMIILILHNGDKSGLKMALVSTWFNSCKDLARSLKSYFLPSFPFFICSPEKGIKSKSWSYPVW